MIVGANNFFLLIGTMSQMRDEFIFMSIEMDVITERVKRTHLGMFDSR